MEHFPILGLPRELRDKILKYVLFRPIEPLPPNAARSTRKDGIGLGGHGANHVFYPSNVPEPRSTKELVSLLCANKQLHAEVNEIIDSVPPSQKYSYTIDVHVRELRELLPSWTEVPFLTNRVEKVHASIHLHAVSLEGQRGAYRVNQGGLILPITLHWSFLNLLDRFLIVGPTYKDFSQTARKRDRWISLRKLIVDVITPADMTPKSEVEKTNWVTPFWVPSKSNGDEMCFLSPRAACDYLHGKLEDLLSARFSAEGYILYERMESIEICLDGEVKHEWNFARMALRWHHRTAYPSWKEKIWTIRARLGLETPEEEG